MKPEHTRCEESRAKAGAEKVKSRAKVIRVFMELFSRELKTLASPEGLHGNRIKKGCIHRGWLPADPAARKNR
jgi:hypothetical protein